MEEPHEDLRQDSGRDSGTMYVMKNKLNTVINEANTMTWVSPPLNPLTHVPIAGLTTKLAANVAET